MTSLREHTIEGFIEALASDAPTPGGGAAAGTVAAMGMSLAGMVLSYTIGKAKFADHDAANTADRDALQDLATHTLTLADADADAYGTLNALWKLPKDDTARVAGWDDAVDAAIDVPMRTIGACIDALERCDAMRPRTNPMLHSDLNGALHLCMAAAHAAAENVRVNLPLVSDTARRNALQASLDTMLKALG